MENSNLDVKRTEIDHSEIFSSPEKFQKILGSTIADNGYLCKSFELPIWHPFKRPTGLIAKIDSGEKCKVVFGFPINPAIDLNTSIKNNWMITEVFEEPFETVKAYFVNGTIFADNDGQYIITNGPEEFTWTFKESSTICVDCK